MKSSKAKEVETVLFSHDELMKALYWAWDGFDRSGINFFCIYETGESVLHKRDLKGEGVYLGVRKLDWQGSSRRVFVAFAGEPDEITERYELYSVYGVPVHIYPFEEDMCIRNPQVIFYEKENFNVPNPIERFIEIYGNRNS